MSDPKCRRCADCASSSHHWGVETFDPDELNLVDEDYLHPATEAILADWKKQCEEAPETAAFAPIVWTCKHCDHWERTESCPECGDFLSPETGLCTDEDCDNAPEWEREEEVEAPAFDYEIGVSHEVYRRHGHGQEVRAPFRDGRGNTHTFAALWVVVGSRFAPNPAGSEMWYWLQFRKVNA